MAKSEWQSYEVSDVRNYIFLLLLVHRRNNVFEPREETRKVWDEWRDYRWSSHQLEEDQRQNRASCIYWKLLLACELHENGNDEGEEMQPIPTYDYANRMALTLISWNTLRCNISLYIIGPWISNFIFER